MTQVGDTVWVFDVNRRVYPPKVEGERYMGSSPIWREHWAPKKIASETRLSWVLGDGKKLPKKETSIQGIAFSAEELDELVWVEENQRQIVRQVQDLRDYATLKRVADLIGYQRDASG